MHLRKVIKIVFITICLLFFGSRQIKAQSAAICQGDSAVIQMNCTYLGTLQWQQSSDQMTWSNILGASLDTIKVTPSSTSYYRAAIASGVCNLVYSDTAVITVNLIPPAPSILVADTCSSSRLTASGYTGTLLWSTGQTVNPITVNSSGTYTVTQTLNACTSSISNGVATPIFAPLSPTAGVSVPSETQIVWNWNAVAGAIGYKYNTVNNYATATDNFASVSYTQTGLSCNTSYSLFVWAYNDCGNSSTTNLLQPTAACFTYSWFQSGWGSCSPSGSWNYSYTTGCSATCGGGTQTNVYSCSPGTGSQTQTVYCLRSDGQIVADSNCSGSGPQPPTSQSCASTTCPGSDPSNTQACNTQACAPPCWASGTPLCWVGGCGDGYTSCWTSGGCADPTPNDGSSCCSGLYITTNTAPDGSYTATGYNWCY